MYESYSFPVNFNIGEVLNKLFQRIARGEMVAETVPDVIRHTQDGISMSNKFKERSHRRTSKDGTRRSSQDDPRYVYQE